MEAQKAGLMKPRPNYPGWQDPVLEGKIQARIQEELDRRGVEAVPDPLLGWKLTGEMCGNLAGQKVRLVRLIWRGTTRQEAKFTAQTASISLGLDRMIDLQIQLIDVMRALHALKELGAPVED